MGKAKPFINKKASTSYNLVFRESSAQEGTLDAGRTLAPTNPPPHATVAEVEDEEGYDYDGADSLDDSEFSLQPPRYGMRLWNQRKLAGAHVV
jgi:hypothetical protein